MGKTIVSPFRTEQRRGVDQAAGQWRGSARRRSSARRRPGGGAKLRGGQGDLSPVLTFGLRWLGEVAPWRGVGGGGG
jgi:hypothetical protein